MRKEEGATVAATPTFPQLAVSSGRTGSVLPWKDPKQWETPINYQKCPTNETPAIFRLQLIGSPIKMNKYKDADESDKNISDLKHKNVNDTNNNCS